MRAPRAWLLRCVALLCLGASAVLAAKSAPASATLLAAGATPSSSDVPPPSFCHGLQCPEYSVLATTKAYDLRRYSPSLWVSTVVTGASYDAAVNQVGARRRRSPPRVRVQGTQRALTLQRALSRPGVQPAVRLHRRRKCGQREGPHDGAGGCGRRARRGADMRLQLHRFLFCSAKRRACAHLDGGIFLAPASPRRVCRQLRGLGEQQKVIAKAAALSQALAEAGVAVDAQDEGFTVAQYDSPFRLADRHNEIWLLAPAPPDNP